ncbi:MAG: class I SAM-dependent methyltransferase, partial [Ignavibacteriae bacterium]|nr:class I SAM-dependent methyltransferase [Ignavibacteriota bacterium]
MSKIKEFYKTDGLDYKFRRWQKYPTGQFDFKCTQNAINKFLLKVNSNLTLEVGCGPGTWTNLIKKHSQNIIAVDISDT